MTKLTWAAPDRNKHAILAVLERVLPASGTLLEVASGTGQHAVHFARHLPDWIIRPSDLDRANLASIESWREEAGLPNLREPIALDVCDDDWGVGALSAIYCANLIHIAPWEATLALLRGAGRHLAAEALLVLYGPYRIDGQHTAPSNRAFDETLRERDPRFGVRDLETVLTAAAQHGLELRERVEMPANNQTLVLRRLG